MTYVWFFIIVYILIGFIYALIKMENEINYYVYTKSRVKTLKVIVNFFYRMLVCPGLVFVMIIYAMWLEISPFKTKHH